MYINEDGYDLIQSRAQITNVPSREHAQLYTETDQTAKRIRKNALIIYDNMD